VPDDQDRDRAAGDVKVAVLGAGVIGVTTAWRLARDGYDVTVVDASDRVARGASSANAGMISPGHAYPWASPHAPWLLLRSLVAGGGKLRITGPLDRDLARWGALFLRECTWQRARRNALVKLRLCMYSERLLYRWAGEQSIDYGARRFGALYLHRSPSELRAAYRRSAIFRANGRDQLLLDASEVQRREPALAAARSEIAGAIFDPGDSSGDAERFTLELARRCDSEGVEFLLGQRIVGLATSGGPNVTAALLADDVVEADAYVLALGSASGRIARTIGERLEIYPVKGYTATFPLRAGARAPSIAGIDEAERVAWSIQGDRLRMATGAEFAGESTAWTAASVEPILRFARRLFPDAADYEAGVFRTGMRPMTPDSVPVISRATHENLIFNTGHGHMGWTMACGSAEIVAALLAGRTPAIGLEGFSARWR
jgi:D-amino-acid dehydrogenase